MAERTVRTLLQLAFDRRSGREAEKGLEGVEARLAAVTGNLTQMSVEARKSAEGMRAAFGGGAGGLAERLAQAAGASAAAEGAVAGLGRSMQQGGAATDAAARQLETYRQRIGAVTEDVRAYTDLATRLSRLTSIASMVGVPGASEALALSGAVVHTHRSLKLLVPSVTELGERAGAAVPALGQAGAAIGNIIGVAPGMATFGLAAGAAGLAVGALTLAVNEWQRRTREAREETQAWVNATREVAERLPALTSEGLAELERAAQGSIAIQRAIIETNTAEFKRVAQEALSAAGADIDISSWQDLQRILDTVRLWTGVAGADAERLLVLFGEIDRANAAITEATTSLGHFQTAAVRTAVAANDAAAAERALAEERARLALEAVDAARNEVNERARLYALARTGTVESVQAEIDAANDRIRAYREVIPTLQAVAQQEGLTDEQRRAVIDRIRALVGELDLEIAKRDQLTAVVLPQVEAYERERRARERLQTTLDAAAREKQNEYARRQQAREQAVDAFVQYRQAIAAIDQRLADNEAALRRSHAQAELKATADHQRALAASHEREQAAILRATADFYQREAAIRARAHKESRRAFEDHQWSLQQAAERNDVLAFVDEQRRYQREKKQREEDQRDAAQEREAEFRNRVAQIREEAAQEREETGRQFREAQRERQRQFAEQLQALRDQATRERALQLQSFVQRLVDLNANLLGEKALRDSYYAAMARDLDAFIAGYRGQLLSLWTTSLPMASASLAGAALGAGGGFTTPAYATVTPLPAKTATVTVKVDNLLVGEVVTGAQLQKQLQDVQRSLTAGLYTVLRD